jgi:hypothetical protein
MTYDALIVNAAFLEDLIIYGSHVGLVTGMARGTSYRRGIHSGIDMQAFLVSRVTAVAYVGYIARMDP